MCTMTTFVIHKEGELWNHNGNKVAVIFLNSGIVLSVEAPTRCLGHS